MEYGADKKSTLARRSFTWKGGVGGSRPWLPSGDKKKVVTAVKLFLGYVRPMPCDLRPTSGRSDDSLGLRTRVSTSVPQC
jgi:hypothetical protein